MRCGVAAQSAARRVSFLRAACTPTVPMSFPGLVSAARGEPQAQGIVCTVGYGKTGISKGVAYSLTWKKYCGPKVDYCYRAHTASPGDMKKLYPEHPWDDTSAFYSEFYVMGCGDDFGFSHTEGCTGTVRRPRIKTNTPPAEHTGPDKEELGSFEVDYCCYNSGCTSGKAHTFMCTG